MSGPIPTASQTVGPFYGLLFLRREPLNELVRPETEGQRIRIEGRVIDGDGAPVEDAMVEIWQANAHGRYNHPADGRDLPLDPTFTGFGLLVRDDQAGAGPVRRGDRPGAAHRGDCLRPRHAEPRRDPAVLRGRAGQRH